MDKLIIKGAREHNLKDITVEMPRDKFVVITGVSGSGKSSLAFDTIYAEGQRRYVESLSAYARQFLGRLDKPDVDYIEGLSPAISIEQRTTSRNPRSTVGTVTEIYDYLRLLFARIGVPHHPVSGERLERQSTDEIIDAITEYPRHTKIMLISPVIRGRKGEHNKLLKDAHKAGYSKARIDGKIVSTASPPKLAAKKKHSIGIVVDRIKIDAKERSRIAEAVELALEMSGGFVDVQEIDSDAPARSFSLNYSYTTKGGETAFPELEPRLFSFNSPYGACPLCHGIGEKQEFDIDLIMPDDRLSYNQGALIPFRPTSVWHRSIFTAVAETLKFSLDDPMGSLPKDTLKQLFNGTRDSVKITYQNKDGRLNYTRTAPFPGVIPELRRRYKETASENMRTWFESFMSTGTCSLCQGKRLKEEALAVQVLGKNIEQICELTIERALPVFREDKFSKREQLICKEVIREIYNRLTFLNNVGLGYISLHRKAGTLSGGEAQRIRLASQIGSSLTSVLYVLDEPTIGLHQRDNDRLLDTLRHLRDLGNTLIVVEHDEQTIRCADYIVELGPGAGVHGGNLVASGTVEEVCKIKKSLTAQYLARKLALPLPKKRRGGNGKQLTIKGMRHNNLKNLSVTLPLGMLVLITGVSGSGKSSLLNGVIYPALSNHLHGSDRKGGKYRAITGKDAINKIIQIDQSPIGRTPRSNPATYVGFFTAIRELFQELPISKTRGYRAGRFSFNVQGGRCEICQGGGIIKLEMHFLSDVCVTCDACKGKRFNQETLEVHYKGKNIHDVLCMTVDEAADFFRNITSIYRSLSMLQSVGLGYIALGQSALTFSGGEAQRIRLANELSRRDTGDTLYILDEPTTGLHCADVSNLVKVIHSLVGKGNSVVVIEHNLDMIAQADHIIDLGPEGGDAGGTLCAEGTPEQLTKMKGTYTGVYLKEYLARYSPE